MDGVQGPDGQRKRFFGPSENSFTDSQLNNPLSSFLKGLAGLNNLMGAQDPGSEATLKNTPGLNPEQSARSQICRCGNLSEPVISFQKAGQNDTGVQIEPQFSARSAFSRS